jgi:hypothetical protein
VASAALPLLRFNDSWFLCNGINDPPNIHHSDPPEDQRSSIESDQTLMVLTNCKDQYSNATLANVIRLYLTGFTQSSPICTDPSNPTVNIFKVNYVTNVNQVGQNLYCFVYVDSIGNQGDTICFLFFTIQIASESQNSLYINNATHFSIDLVCPYRSIRNINPSNGNEFSSTKVCTNNLNLTRFHNI